jgi:hypothetical protein
VINYLERSHFDSREKMAKDKVDDDDVGRVNDKANRPLSTNITNGIIRSDDDKAPSENSTSITDLL